MKRRLEIIALLLLLVVLAWVVYSTWFQSPETVTGTSAPAGNLQPLNVPDPDLKLDILDQISKQEYAGTRRDIFNFQRDPPPPPDPRTAQPQQPVDTAPPPLPPVVPPFRYYGYADYLITGLRRGFFTNGEEIWVAAEGDVLLGRFRVISLQPKSAVVEELSSSRRATLIMEELPSP